MSVERMKEIGREIASQDNYATDAPLFVVRQRLRIYRVDLSFADDSVWVNIDEDCREATSEESAEIDLLDQRGSDTGCWILVGYVDTWEHVTSAFTARECLEYIRANKHRLRDPQMYVGSLYRNSEMQAIRNYLIELGQQ